MEQNTAQASAPVSGTQETPAQGDITPKYVLLAREQKALRLEKEKIKQEREAWAKERSGAGDIDSKYKDLDSRLSDKNAFIQVLLEKGHTPEEIAQAILNGPKQQDVELMSLKKEIEGLKGETSSTKKLFEQQEQKQKEQVDKQMLQDIKTFVDASPDFELIKANGAYETVLELIKKDFEETGILKEESEVAKEVEEFLLEDAIRVASYSKVQQKLNPPKEESKFTQNVKQPFNVQSREKQVQTLTHAATANPTKPLTAKDRRQRAIEAFKGNLK